MSYTKHNYKKGDELLASQLNDMDDQIALNEQTADTLVTVSNTQPAAAKNRVWVKATPSEIEIPTMDDHNELSRHLSDINGIVYKKSDNLIDFGILGNTWIQGKWDNASLPYLCHSVHLNVEDGQSKIYLAFNGARFESETGYDSNGAVYVIFFDANDNRLSENSASRDYQGPYAVDIPSETSYFVIQLSTSVWGNSLTPSMLDSVELPFAYVGYKTVAPSDIPNNFIPYPEDNDKRITALESAVSGLNSDIANIHNDLSNVAIYIKSDTPETLTQGGGYYQPDGTLYQPTSTQFLHYDAAVSGENRYSVSGFFTNDARFVSYIFFDENNRVLSYGQASEVGDQTVEAVAPSGAVKIGINNYVGHTASCYIYVQEDTKEYIAEQASYWYGKKIVWFGTSIPAGGINAGDSGYSGAYPNRIGQMLGATVYNEAVGSSCARGGDYQAITENDPMGWAGMGAIGVMLSLSLSSVEKQDIINNWDSKWKNIIGIPESYDSTATATYLESSWDIKLAKYLTGGSVGQCDLYVFDHGYNDYTLTSGFSKLSEVPESQNDRTYWFGAMNFLVGKILSDNPKAKILIICHYNYGADAFNRGANYRGKYVCDAQKAYAELWGFSCVETWKLLGLSMNNIDVNGASIPVIYARYPDHLHPVSDSTGYELQRYADALAPYVDLARGT